MSDISEKVEKETPESFVAKHYGYERVNGRIESCAGWTIIGDASNALYNALLSIAAALLSARRELEELKVKLESRPESELHLKPIEIAMPSNTMNLRVRPESELPTDEEIEKEAESDGLIPSDHLYQGFVSGAQWMRDKLTKASG